MNVNNDMEGISKDIIFRLRAKMDDNVFQEVAEGDLGILAFRIPGEKIDLLNSLEYLAEYLTIEAVTESQKLLLISDQDYQVTDISMIIPKLETKKQDDERLYNELKDSLGKTREPLVFTTENDILDIYRMAIRVDGSHDRPDPSIGLELLKMDLPKEGEIVYLIFDDGFRKMPRYEFERFLDESLSSLRHGPDLLKDPRKNSLSKMRQMDMVGSVEAAEENNPKIGITGEDAISSTGSNMQDGEISTAPRMTPDQVERDPKVVVRELSRSLSDMGYRKDTKFSRTDVHQVFFIGMKGPAIFFKFLDEPNEMDSFLRVLSHRKDALGLLVTESWDPAIEAISRINGFIYLERAKTRRIPDVIRAIIKEGGGS